MRSVKRLSFVIVALCAFSALAVSSASAHPTFLAHPLTLLLATADNTQSFFTPGGALTVECSKVKLSPPDTTLALQFLSILVTANYENCEIVVLGITTVHPVRYIIFANGLVRLDSDVKILAPLCTITIPAAKNQSLKTVKFDNQPDGSVLLLANVKGITSSGAGAGCPYGEESNGEYKGNVRVTAHGGVIRWDP